ncbi:MFS transporter [Paraherbaspirillum soli]|uniref:Multidrug efflux pump Tap n=1 Tax=Paraherbaspirillum soli TaxID=631222 RepID=A0ABW0M8J6_9BURK
MRNGVKHRLDNMGRPFRALLISDALMLLAQMVGYVVLPWWIAHQGGARDLALYGMVLSVAAFIAMPLWSPFGDRIPKRTQIAVGLAARASIALLVAILASCGHYNIVLLIAAGIVTTVSDTIITPASSTIAAELIPAEKLSDALSLQKTAQAAGRIAGPALGGGMLAAAGTPAALWLSCALLMLAAMLATRIPPPSAAVLKTSGAAHWWFDLKAGLAVKWQVPLERGWTLVNFITWIFMGPALTMLIPLKVQALGLSGAWLGACEAALSLGMLGGALWGAGFLAKTFGRYQVRVGAGVIQGLALTLAGFTQWPLVLMAAFLCAGMANSAVVLIGLTHRTLAIPRDFRVRITAVNIMSTLVAGALGPAAAGAALTHWSVSHVYIAFGLASTVCATGFVLVPRFREFFSLDHEQVKDWYQLQYPQVFPAAAAQGEHGLDRPALSAASSKTSQAGSGV